MRALFNFFPQAYSYLRFSLLWLQVDHDVCSNYGNWLYSAGVGNDPRQDRKFNMVKQGLDYDPQVFIYDAATCLGFLLCGQ